jgi:hypothetical protein
MRAPDVGPMSEASDEATNVTGVSTAPAERQSSAVQCGWDTALIVVAVSVSVVLDSPAPDIVYRAF